MVENGHSVDRAASSFIRLVPIFGSAKHRGKLPSSVAFGLLSLHIYAPAEHSRRKEQKQWKTQQACIAPMPQGSPALCQHSPHTPRKPCTPGLCISLPREDSDAEEDGLTLKVMSESLSSWEPLKDPDGVVVSGLDCRVPGSRRESEGGTGPASPHVASICIPSVH